MIRSLPSFLTHGATLLALSALISKGLSLVRDRLVLDIFKDPAVVDAIYASFRVPDFFFFLFITSTISVIFIPRIEKTHPADQNDYFASFFWGIALIFGAISLSGFMLLPVLVPWLFGTLDLEAQALVIRLSRWLFLASFLLAIQSLFSAYSQWRERFWVVALNPILYMGGVVVGLWILHPYVGVKSIAFGAIAGIILSLTLSRFMQYRDGTRLPYLWGKPHGSWRGFGFDFGRRVIAASSFQINQTIDVIIASRLIPGSITSFSIGTALGHFLLSVVGYSVSNALFPKLAKAKSIQDQWPIMRQGIGMILIFTIPSSLVAIWLAPWALAFFFTLEGSRLYMTQTVFVWTVASLPFACLIPIFSRSFLARDDTTTPLVINYISLAVATLLAAYLSLIIFTGKEAIIGLAIGNFTANTLSFSLFAFIYYKTFQCPKSTP